MSFIVNQKNPLRHVVNDIESPKPANITQHCYWTPTSLCSYRGKNDEDYHQSIKCHSSPQWDHCLGRFLQRSWARSLENLHRCSLAWAEAACDIWLWKLAEGVGLTSERSLTADYFKTDVRMSGMVLAVPKRSSKTVHRYGCSLNYAVMLLWIEQLLVFNIAFYICLGKAKIERPLPVVRPWHSWNMEIQSVLFAGRMLLLLLFLSQYWCERETKCLF